MNGLTESVVIYEGGEARVEVRVERESVWLSLQQLAELFGRDKSVISCHLKAIFASGEPVINDVGLAALALLVAESDARNKDVMIRLVTNMLAGPQS
jgi:hypothetical protein